MDFTQDGNFTLEDVVAIAIAITAILGACTLIARQIVKPISRWMQKQFQQAVTDTIAGPLEEIRHEVTANDGSSLRDLVLNNHSETLGIFKERDARYARLAQPAERRLTLVENAVSALAQGHDDILERIDTNSNQAARDAAKVLKKIDQTTEAMIEQATHIDEANNPQPKEIGP